MFIIKLLSNFFKLFTKDNNPTQVGLGFAMGFLISFQPFTLLSVIFFFIFWIFKVNKTAGFISFFIFKFIAFLIEPLVVPIGSLLLEGIPSLEPFWTSLRSAPIVPYTEFYNTSVMGGLIVGIVGFIPVTLIFRKLYIIYKEKYREKIAKSKFMKIFKGLPIINLFFKVNETIN